MNSLRRYTKIALLATFALALAPSCLAQYNVLLRIDGVAGESTVANHAGDIDGTAFSFGMSIPISVSAGGGVAGRPTFTDLSVTKFVDKASPALMLDLARGERLRTVVLFVQVTHPVVVDFYKVTLTDVILTSVNSSGDVNGRPTQTVTFNYAKIRIDYTPIKPDGSVGATVSSCFDLVAGTSC
jgi:type VI secretion system secreted protein Hcp